MTPSDFSAALLGGASLVAGLLLLRFAWGKSLPGHIPLLWAAWGLVALSFWPWATAFGFDRGPAGAVVLFMLGGLSLVLGRAFGAKAPLLRARKIRGDRAPEASRHKRWRAWVTFAFAGPLAGVAACLLSTAAFGLVGWLGLTPADQLAITVILMPLAWAAFAVASASSATLGLRGSVLGAAMLAGGLGTAFFGYGA